MRLKGAIFDMDGTVVDVSYDWVKIKAELMTGGKPILHYLQGLEEPERSQKWEVLERYEHKATQKAKLKPGMDELQELKLKSDECCVIGDSHFDIHAAAEAGIPYTFILNADRARFDGLEAEVFSSVEELQSRVEDLLKKEDR
jgi:phosphoglycolate phosphatase-like HAD superfamily hydrolase